MQGMKERRKETKKQRKPSKGRNRKANARRERNSKGQNHERNLRVNLNEIRKRSARLVNKVF